MSIRNLEALLAPRRVALIGASPRPGSLGAAVLTRLRAGGFGGAIDLVNPKYAEVDGSACVPSLAALPVPPDLGVLVTPPATVPGLIAELGAVGARAAIVITAGLDAAQRQAMLDAAKPNLLRILGPNGLGLQVPPIGLDATFAHRTARAGNLALLSQSGAIVTAMIDWAHERDVGFSAIASMGEMADVDVGDLLDYLASDPATAAILMYLEGVTEARKFMSAARLAARAKPVIVVKSGRTARASEAARSHTGALAGMDAVYDAAFARAGILRVEGLADLFAAAEALARHRPLRSDRLAIVTNGGGAGVLAVDRLAAAGAQLAELSPETIDALDKVLPANWSHANPVDIIGDAPPARYVAALDIVLRDKAADAILVMNCPSGLASSAEAAEAVATRLAMRPTKPAFAAWLGGEAALAGARPLESAGVPTYPTPDEAVDAFGYLVGHYKAQRQLLRVPPADPDIATPDRARAHEIIETALRSGRTILSEVEAKGLLAAYGIPTVPTEVAHSADEAANIARKMLRNGHGAVVAKILSHDITHKSDVGGVRLHLASPHEVRQAAGAMMDHARTVEPDARIEGVVVQPMIVRPNAYELIVGVHDDPAFGPVVLFGSGGTAVEVMADKALALPPLDPMLAGDLLDQTRIGRLLRGFRSTPPADREAITAVLVAVGHMVADLPQLRELDINPLLADPSGVIALDARVMVRQAPAVAPGGNPRLAIRPYPSSLEKTLTVGGTQMTVRPIKPSDHALYPNFLAKVKREDLRWRFFAAIASFSEEDIARLTQVDYARAMAFIAVDDATGELLGVARLNADPDNARAEFAVIVRSDRKREGIARALMTTLIDYARGEGIGLIFGHVLRGNSAMLGLCRSLGMRPVESVREHVTLALPLRSPEVPATGA